MGFNPKFLYQKLASLVHVVSAYLHPFFGFIFTYIFRLQRYGNFYLKKNDKGTNFLEAGRGLPLDCEKEKNCNEFRGFYDEEDKKELSLNFKFQSFEEFNRIQRENDFVFNSEVIHSSYTSKYGFTSGKGGGFIHEMETFSVEEEDSYFSDIEEVFLDENLEQIHEKTGYVFQKGKGEENEETVPIEFTEFSEDSPQSAQEQEEFIDESQFLSHNNSLFIDSDSDSDSDSTSSEHKHSLTENNGFLSDRDFEGGTDTHHEADKMESDSKFSDFQENQEISGNLNEKEIFNDENDSEKPKLNESSSSSSGDANKLESLWEHQELIEQLKMELRNVRSIGLPTIFEEESESPTIIDDLKPWKIDETMQHEDCMGELHKFYKSYSERMRKFDILNYQKMYAMGFLQLKDPHQKRSPPTLRSLVSQNLWLFKHKVNGSDPVKKFVKELEGDLELVYVGHICLSWEFLHWQYQKALELWHSDAHGVHRYNEIAGEFQQFQVLLQRFIEDEAFQGPRVQNYVKSRCVLRNLLQVPVIRAEDDSKHKDKARKNDTDEYAITSEMLVETVEESIQIFWLFVRADKDCTTATNKKIPELDNAADHKLVVQLRKILQKKERRLKDLLRSENCILRKFRRTNKEDDSDQVLYFFSQIDMKLVSRVLNMSKINRDQLVWCQNKLSRISFVNRKICIDPAFLLFPC